MTSWLSAPRPAALLVLLAALLPYVSALDCGFVWDDKPVVLEDARVREVSRWPEIATRPYGSDVVRDPLYRPVTVFSYALDHAIWGASPRAFHATSMLLHAVTCVLLLLLFRRIVEPLPATLAALLFAVHPVHVEAVTWITGRSDLLAGGFGALAAWLHVRAPGSPHRRALRIAALGAYLAGLGCKEVIAGLPLVLVALDWLQGRPVPRRWLIACGVGFLGYVGVRTLVIGHFGSGLSLFEAWQLESGVRWRAAGAVLWDQVRLVFWPWRLSADYAINRDPFVAREAADAAGAWLGLLLAIGVLPLVAGLRRRNPAVSFGLLWYALLLFPASNLLLGIGILEAERLLYLPSAGLLLVVVAGLTGVPRLRPAAIVLLLVALPVLAGRTFLRNLDWRDDGRLFESMIAAEPRNPHAHCMLGTVLTRAGRLDEAAHCFDRALRLRANDGAALAGRAEIRRLQGDIEGALADLNAAQACRPTVRTRVNRALALLEAGQGELAHRELEATVEANPDDADAWNGLGAFHLHEKDFVGARRAFEHGLALRPGDPMLLSNHGLARFYVGDVAGALRDQEEAIRRDPTLADGHQRRGVILYNSGGDLGEAERSLREGIRLSAADASIWNVLALVLCARRAPEELAIHLHTMQQRGIAVRPEVLEEAEKLRQ